MRACLTHFNNNLVQIIEAKTAGTNFTWLYFEIFDSFVLPYINSNISYSVYLFGIRCSFAIDLFSNVLSRTFVYFLQHIHVPTK